MESIPRFLSGIFMFTGEGLIASSPLGDSLKYTVPSDKRSQLVYLRAGNSSDHLICLTLMRDGKPMRLFPIGAKAAEHVPLTVVEDLEPDTVIEVHVSAPSGASGHVILDLGLIEV